MTDVPRKLKTAEVEGLCPYEELPEGASKEGWQLYVCLKPGHSLEKHFEFLAELVKLDPKDYFGVTAAFDICSHQKVAYGVELIEDRLPLAEKNLQMIRSDPGVEKVIECSFDDHSNLVRQIRHPIRYDWIAQAAPTSKNFRVVLKYEPFQPRRDKGKSRREESSMTLLLKHLKSQGIKLALPLKDMPSGSGGTATLLLRDQHSDELMYAMLSDEVNVQYIYQCAGTLKTCTPK